MDKDSQKIKGTFVVSIDYEYAWGYADRSLSEADLARIRGEEEITRQLLALFEKYNVPATWAVVGKLFEKGEDAAWHDRGLIKEIADAKVGHEIGSHSFAHIEYDRSDVDVVRADIKSAIAAHTKAGFQAPASFIFPRNREAHHTVLKENGVCVYRGLRRRWYHHLPGILKRLGHLLDALLPLNKTVQPTVGKDGLINVPDSALLFARNGVRKFLPASLVAWNLRQGLRDAAVSSRVFHLWFHPSNFSWATETQFKIFESILKEAALLRTRGVLDTKTMRDAAHVDTALVLDGELKSALAIVRSLGMHGIEVACGSSRGSGMALASKFCAQKFVYRSPLKDPEGALADIAAAARNMPPPLIVCSSDATLLLVSRNREKLEGIARVFLPPKEVVERVCSKSDMAALARELGIPTPKEFAQFPDGYPAVVKPRHTVSWQSGGSQDTAVIVSDKVTLLRERARITRESGEEAVVQEFLSGREYGVEVLARDGEILSLMAHLRIRSLNPRGGASVVKKTIEPTVAMRDAAQKIITTLHWSGVAMLEFKEDTRGEARFLEMNGRFWGSLPLALHAGVDFPWRYYEVAQGQEAHLSEAKIGVVSRHFWGDVRSLMSVLFARDSLRAQLYPPRMRALMDFLTPGARGDVWSWSDPAPALAEIVDIVRRFI